MRLALVVISLCIVGAVAVLLRRSLPVVSAVNLIKEVATPHAVTKWEHGWKTHRVIATRYSNEQMGFNIGFKFPLNPNDCDRAEISDFIESKNGSIYQGGGYPGAEAYAQFEGVTDVATADKKLLAILPDLDKLMDDITKGKKIAPIKSAEPELTMAQWIEKVNAKKEPCTGAEGDWLGSGSNGYNSWTVRCKNGVRVTEDTTAETKRYLQQEQAHKRELTQALTTRVLTDKEMQEVAQYGSSLLTQPMTPYRPEDVDNQFRTLLEIQRTLLARQAVKLTTQ